MRRKANLTGKIDVIQDMHFGGRKTGRQIRQACPSNAMDATELRDARETPISHDSRFRLVVRGPRPADRYQPKREGRGGRRRLGAAAPAPFEDVRRVHMRASMNRVPRNFGRP
jgi:hypothetical protein